MLSPFDGGKNSWKLQSIGIDFSPQTHMGRTVLHIDFVYVYYPTSVFLYWSVCVYFLV